MERKAADSVVRTGSITDINRALIELWRDAAQSDSRDGRAPASDTPRKVGRAAARETVRSLAVEVRSFPGAGRPLPSPGVSHRARESQSERFDEGYVAGEPGSSAPLWMIALTHQFTKAALKIDRKLQGRVLEAIANISVSPTVQRGDTVKPLDGDLRGKWRYRIGDYRLVYKPDAATAKILLLDFVPRGGAYQ